MKAKKSKSGRIIDLGPNNEILNLSDFSKEELKRIDENLHQWVEYKNRPIVTITEALRHEKVAMSEETKQRFKEIQEQKRQDKKEKKKRLDQIVDVEKQLMPVAKSKKTPTYLDQDKQITLLLKYPWAIPNTFKQDPHKENSTIVDIKCQKCSATRTIHIQDLFQVKYCLKCRGK